MSSKRILTSTTAMVAIMVYKNILLRMKANLETDPVRRQALSPRLTRCEAAPLN